MTARCHIRDTNFLHDVEMFIIRYFFLIAHLFSALFQAVFLLSWAGQNLRQTLIKCWCRQLLWIFNIRLQVNYQEPLPEGAIFFVANHISWIDIHLINSWRPVRFVAKSEVSSWLFFGYLARRLNTLFIDRNNRGASHGAVQSIVKELDGGHDVCVFPEGTSTDGRDIRNFYANLFQAPIESHHPCIPLAIIYKDAKSGGFTDVPAFIGDMGLIESILRMMRSPAIQAFILVTGACKTVNDRKCLSMEARDKIINARN